MMNATVISVIRKVAKAACSKQNHKNLQVQYFASLNSFSSSGPVKLGYESSISLRSLYPTSSLQITTPVKRPEDKDGKFSGFIPLDSLEISYSRSSGPGGQNVNKVNTKVDIRFNVDAAEWLAKDVREKLKDKFKMRITKDGFFVIRSEKTRSQQLNLADALERLRTTIRQIEEDMEVKVLPPETEELIRKRKDKANRQRLAEKRTRSMKKADRQATSVDF